MTHSKTVLISKQIKSISAYTYQLLLLATNFKIKFWVNKQLEVSSESTQLIPISTVKQN